VNPKPKSPDVFHFAVDDPQDDNLFTRRDMTAVYQGMIHEMLAARFDDPQYQQALSEWREQYRAGITDLPPPALKLT